MNPYQSPADYEQDGSNVRDGESVSPWLGWILLIGSVGTGMVIPAANNLVSMLCMTILAATCLVGSAVVFAVVLTDFMRGES